MISYRDKFCSSFKATQNYEYGCDELDGDAVWCV